jgi:hypothetical protein
MVEAASLRKKRQTLERGDNDRSEAFSSGPASSPHSLSRCAILLTMDRFNAEARPCLTEVPIYGVRPSRTLEQAAAKFVIDNHPKRSIDHDISRLRGLMPWIGAMAFDKIHMGSLQPWIEHRRTGGVSAGTM